MIHRIFRASRPALKLWFIASLLFGAGTFVTVVLTDDPSFWWISLLSTAAAALGSIPILIALCLSIALLYNSRIVPEKKSLRVLAVSMISCIIYGLAGAALIQGVFFWSADSSDYFQTAGISIAALIGCALPSWLISRKTLIRFFITHNYKINNLQSVIMEPTIQSEHSLSPNQAGSNSILIKGLITGGLILVMMIPTLFISNLVNEREKRQQEVVEEVSSKWSSSQTLSGPFIFLPYTEVVKNKEGKPETIYRHVWLLPEDLKVKGVVSHHIRPRSIYKVMLYRAALQTGGTISIQAPKDLIKHNVLWNNAKICYGITDFKGIEEKLSITVNGTAYELSPGLPANDLIPQGLSASIPMKAENLGELLSFSLALKLKGSEQLHFMPLSGNSSFELNSDWHSPSFDGNNLPADREVNDSGFTAKWTFNKANLPFGTLLENVSFEPEKLAFGVTLLQPADQYAKTNRSIKYAILFIGLTFSLFFIVELMQKKPLHPVQYTLIGLALVIFFTLLLSVSEFLLFDTAYGIAAAATILLVTCYAASHFKSWKPAMILSVALVLLYGFIFVLIRLEDTALLIGSIGLFIVLAIAMYFSRKINWYGAKPEVPTLVNA